MHKIFDSLCHPTDFKQLDLMLSESHYEGACVVGCDGYLDTIMSGMRVN